MFAGGIEIQVDAVWVQKRFKKLRFDDLSRKSNYIPLGNIRKYTLIERSSHSDAGKQNGRILYKLYISKQQVQVFFNVN